MRILLSLLLLLLPVPVLAAPAMWRIHDADTEIILFGTIHELPALVNWQSPRIMAAFDAADTLVVEVDIPEDPYAMARIVQQFGVQSGLPPLADRVAKDKRNELLALVARSRLPIAALDRMETWLAAVTLSDSVVGAAGFASENGADSILMTRARGASKPIVGLETIAQQLGFFDSLNESDQRALLLATLEDLKTAPRDIDKLVQDWLSGDVDAIAANADRELRNVPVLREVLVTKRNAAWASWIEAVLKRPGKVFVAVGAAHLAGPDSVQSMLAAKGVVVERLP
ncbi:MAG: TraB/GumN family protein [Polymorphobacter sp.]